MAHKYVKIEKFEELFPFEGIHTIKLNTQTVEMVFCEVNPEWTGISNLVGLFKNGLLYKKVESPWWEDIPEHGVLVWVDAGGTKWLRRVTNHHLRDLSVQNMDAGVQQYDAVECENSYISVDKCTPLTDYEIEQFLRGE